MFDREGFMEYVGEKSGNSYASGLARIEKYILSILMQSMIRISVMCS